MTPQTPPKNPSLSPEDRELILAAFPARGRDEAEPAHPWLRELGGAALILGGLTAIALLVGADSLWP